MHLDPSYLFSNVQSLNIESLVSGDNIESLDVTQENTNIFDNVGIGTQSLPQSSNLKGTYGFDVLFGPQEKPTKSTAWTYSEVKDKLYVTKGVPCPINFFVSSTPPPGTVIRAMAIFVDLQHSMDIVRRCLNHSDPNDPTNNGVSYPDHLIQCSNYQSVYEASANYTHRHSVIVPYERPPAGMDYSTYIYKFMCWSSCVGGLNRRPIKVVFSLEKDGVCLGRRSLEVKICACPGRDRRNDEKHVEKEHSQNSSRIPVQSELELSMAYFDSDSEPPCKKKKMSNSSDENSFTIKVYNKGIYEILLVLKVALELSAATNPQFLSQFGKHWKKTFKKENFQEETE